MSTADKNRLIMGWQTAGKDTGADHLRLVPHPCTGSTALPENQKLIYAPKTGHIASFAPANADINTASIIPNLMHYEGSAIILTPSAEIYNQTHQHRRDMGQEIYLIDPFGMTGAEKGSLNILQSSNPRQPDNIEDYFRMASVFASKDLAMDLHIRQATHLVAAAFMWAAQLTNPEKRHISTAYDFLNRPLETIINDIDKGQAKDNGRGQWKEIFRHLQRNKRSPAHEMALTWLEFCLFSKTGQATSQNSFPIEALTGNRPVTLYILLLPAQMKTYAPLIRLWLHFIGQLIEKRCERPDANTIIFLPEAARYMTSEVMSNLMQIPPDAGLQLWSFWHNLKQLEQIHYDFSEFLTHNISCLQTYGHMSCKASYDMKMSFTNGLIQDIMTIPDGQQGLQIHDRSFFTCYRLDRNREDITTGKFAST